MKKKTSKPGLKGRTGGRAARAGHRGELRALDEIENVSVISRPSRSAGTAATRKGAAEAVESRVEDVQTVAQRVLTVEFLALDGASGDPPHGTEDADEEGSRSSGAAPMTLEQTVRDIGSRLGLTPEDQPDPDRSAS